MKCSGRNAFMNKSMTFQHLHLEGNAAWVVIIWLWKAHSLFKSSVLYMFRKGPLGMIQGLLEQKGVSRFSGLWIRCYMDRRNWKWITILWRVWECCTVIRLWSFQNKIATAEERWKVCGIKPLRTVVSLKVVDRWLQYKLNLLFQSLLRCTVYTFWYPNTKEKLLKRKTDWFLAQAYQSIERGRIFSN